RLPGTLIPHKATAPTNPQGGGTQSPPPGPDSSPPTGGGPLIGGATPLVSIIDQNNVLVLTPNVSVNDFSTYPVKLDGNVTAAASPTYAWDLTNAPDASGATGTTTYRLSFTWATFTGAAKTDTVKFTATVSGVS